MRRSYGRGSEYVIGQAAKTGPRSSEPGPVKDQTKQLHPLAVSRLSNELSSSLCVSGAEMETEISGLPCGVEPVLRLSCFGLTDEGHQLRLTIKDLGLAQAPGGRSAVKGKFSYGRCPW